MDIEKELKSTISGELKRIRKEKDITLESMADHIGIEYTALYNIYTGSNLPRLPTLVKISKAYGIPCEFWFKNMEGFVTTPQVNLQKKIREAEVLQVFNSLDNDIGTAMLSVLKGYIRKNKRKVD